MVCYQKLVIVVFRINIAAMQSRGAAAHSIERLHREEHTSKQLAAVSKFGQFLCVHIASVYSAVEMST